VLNYHKTYNTKHITGACNNILIEFYYMLHAYMLSDMKIKPLNDRVVIEPMAAEEVKKFGKVSIVLPQTADKERPEQGKVISVGPGKFDEDGEKRIPLGVKKGDVVLFTKYGPSEIKIDGKEYLIAREEDILAILE